MSNKSNKKKKKPKKKKLNVLSQKKYEERIRKEKELWSFLQNDWNKLDRVYVTKTEFKEMRDSYSQITLKELFKVKDVFIPFHSLFSNHQRVFLDDVIFVVKDNEDTDKIIRVHKEGNEIGRVLVFTGSGQLYWNTLITIEDSKIRIQPDPLTPYGLWLYEEAVKVTILTDHTAGNIAGKVKDLHSSIYRTLENEMIEIIDFLFGTMTFILNQEVSIIESSPKHSTNATPSKNASIATPSKKQIQIIKLSGLTRREQLREHSEDKRNYHKNTESWTVRGHWRTYKNTGKKIWIDPYVKGENLDKDIKGKNYVL